MTRIKVFSNKLLGILESEVNLFISNDRVLMVDIRYSTTLGEENDYHYIIVIYKSL